MGNREESTRAGKENKRGTRGKQSIDISDWNDGLYSYFCHTWCIKSTVSYTSFAKSYNDVLVMKQSTGNHYTTLFAHALESTQLRIAQSLLIVVEFNMAYQNLCNNVYSHQLGSFCISVVYCIHDTLRLLLLWDYIKNELLADILQKVLDYIKISCY